MRFLADMGVSLRVVDWLRIEGHEVVHLRDEGLQRLPNGNIFAKAAQERRIVLTFDLDFGEILASTANELASVILFRMRNKRTANAISRLRHVLSVSAKALDEGAIIVVEDARHRVRRLPF